MAVVSVTNRTKRRKVDCPHSGCRRRGENGLLQKSHLERHLKQTSVEDGHPVCGPDAGCREATCCSSATEAGGPVVEEVAAAAAAEGALGVSPIGGGGSAIDNILHGVADTMLEVTLDFSFSLSRIGMT